MTLIGLLVVATAGPSQAFNAGTPDISATCDRAAAVASRESGVPLSVLRAISLTETGRRQGGAFRAWPWTVNMEGKGAFFEDMGEGLAFVEQAMARGAASFDIGCFQINYRWHGENFASVREMFDPVANARYAARFLANLYAELGDWSQAAGAFHSRTRQYADRYRARFDRIHADLGGDPGPTAGPIPEIPDIVLAENKRLGLQPRVNQYPLLQGGGGAGGSLFPAAATGRGALFASAARPLVGAP